MWMLPLYLHVNQNSDDDDDDDDDDDLAMGYCERPRPSVRLSIRQSVRHAFS